MSSKKKRFKTKLKSIPTLEFLQFKTFNMIDGEFKGGNVYLTHRNPHGRWSIQYHSENFNSIYDDVMKVSGMLRDNNLEELLESE